MPRDLGYDEVIDNLIQKTEDGKLGWQSTAEDSKFICVLEGEFTFSITKFDYQGDDRCYFSMTDSSNAEIIGLGASFGEFRYNKLAELHEVARRSALDVHRKVDHAADILRKI